MDNQYEDREITCVQCKNTFWFPARDQEFFAKKGFTDPKRCKPCREAAKQNQPAL